MTRRLLLAFLIALLVRLAPAWAEGDFRPNQRPIVVPPIVVPDGPPRVVGRPPGRTPVTAPEIEERNLQGMWWASPAGSEPGWGLHIVHQGAGLVISLFAYDTDGRPAWLTGDLGYDGRAGRYSGKLHRATGPVFSEIPWDPAKVQRTEVGQVVFLGWSGNDVSFQYVWLGVLYQKRITRYVFASPAPKCDWSMAWPTGSNYTDLWWHSPAGSESGWGVTLAHQGNTLFAVWFTYRADRKDEWIMMSNGMLMADGSFSGTLSRSHGPPRSTGPWDASLVSTEPVGTATFTFTSDESGTFAYTLDGVTQTKTITRYRFSSPPTVCE